MIAQQISIVWDDIVCSCKHLKFPGSDSYSVNYGEQYRSGYILPCPDAPISEKMYQIMQKACRYEPDDRYQSMEEMLKELDKVTVSEVTGYRADHIRGHG